MVNKARAGALYVVRIFYAGLASIHISEALFKNVRGFSSSKYVFLILPYQSIERVSNGLKSVPSFCKKSSLSVASWKKPFFHFWRTDGKARGIYCEAVARVKEFRAPF